MNAVHALDVFCHWAPEAFCRRAMKLCREPLPMLERAVAMPVVTDLQARLELVSEFAGYAQIPCLVSPPIETICDGTDAVDLARVANDGMAAMCAEEQTVFPAFVASLPLGDIPASLQEAERAVTQLGAAGVQVFTSIRSGAIDTPEMLDVYDLMAKLDRPIWLHPCLKADVPDYANEERSQHELWWALGWPYETSKAMYRLVLAGVFDRWPDLKIIAHHGGGIIPMLEGRLGAGMHAYGRRTSDASENELPIQEPLMRAFRRFYADTATFGSQAALECALSFFGYQRLLFASDMPFGPEAGCHHIRTSLAAIDAAIPDGAQRQDVLRRNAETLVT